MVRWVSISLLVLSTSLVSGQWTQSQYPQSEYPQTQGPQQQQTYEQGAYPENAPPPPQGESTQNQPPAAPDPNDLQHGVARVSIAQGDVNVQRGDNGQLSGAVINTPLVARDHLQTATGSRAEVELDAASLLRLAPNTDVGFADLQYHRAQVQLGLGTVIFRVLQSSPTQVEIDTPSVGIRALVPGEYRISVFDNGTSQITVHSGQVEISAPRGTENLNAGSSVLVRGDSSNPEMQDAAAPPPDQFDEWSAQRDHEFTPAQSYQYLNSDYQGADDLDRYGSWVPSGYGQVWRPQGVSPDWAPYSDGQWSYLDYYGWSWIDSAPWGWAPYHYGRWFLNPGYGWCWWAGPRLHPAYWSPAMVGFFGVGGGIGWVALAPYEVCHPWWGRHGGGFGYGGFGYAGFGLGGYRNAGFRGGVLFASAGAFGGVHQRFAFANRTQISGARAITGGLPVTATRASYMFSNRTVTTNNRFSAIQSRTFFHQSGSSRAFTQAPQVRSFAGPANGNGPSVTGNKGGWAQFGSPGSGPRANFHGTAENSGWHAFGQSQPSANSFQSVPRNSSPQSAPRYSQPAYQQPRSYQYSAPRQSFSQPSPGYNAPRQNYSAPRQNYSAPRQAPEPHYSAPSAPRGGGGGGGGSHGGGGGGHHGR